MTQLQSARLGIVTEAMKIVSEEERVEAESVRAAFDWQRQFALSLDPECARMRWLKTRAHSGESHCDDHCSMCGKEFCAVRTSKRIRKLSENLSSSEERT